VAYGSACDSRGQPIRIVTPPRTWAELFAHLASLPRLDAIDTGERRLLAESLTRLLYMTKDKTSADVMLGQRRSLELAHRAARGVVWALLTGAEVVPSRLGAQRVWRLQDGILREGWSHRPPAYAVTRVLFGLLDGPAFPFGRCEACEQIFVRQGRQLYCSPACATRTTEKRRSATPERREYMRQLMARRRQAEREARQAKGTKPRKGDS